MSSRQLGRAHRNLLLGAGVSMGCLLPIWMAHYLPIYDYANHLLEAHVVAHYNDPALRYAASYQISNGWYLRSNALSTLLMIGLMQMFPWDIVGRLILSLYIVLFIGGLAWFLRVLERPVWLVLAAPTLVYNLTFTTGMLNWCYGLALALWAIPCYVQWTRHGARTWLVACSILLLLSYTAHLFAWALCLLVLITLAAMDRLTVWQWTQLCVALMSALPVLLITRPLYALIPPLLCGAGAGMAWIVRRLQLRKAHLGLFGAGIIGVTALVWRGLRPTLLAWFPDVGYSPHSKLMSVPRLFTLPYYSVPIDRYLAILNLGILGLGMVMIGIWVWQWRQAEPRWLAVIGVLACCYALIPTRTHDIILTEPRVLLLISCLGLIAVPIKKHSTRKYDLSVHQWSFVVLLTLACLSTAGIWRYTRHYDNVAEHWADTFAHVPNAQRVLVLANPPVLPAERWSQVTQLSQVFDPNQFASVYALEHGGFVSNTFFNGPLLPQKQLLIPPYWWDGFQPAAYLHDNCASLRTMYPYALVWDQPQGDLDRAHAQCYEHAAHRAP